MCTAEGSELFARREGHTLCSASTARPTQLLCNGMTSTLLSRRPCLAPTIYSPKLCSSRTWKQGIYSGGRPSFALAALNFSKKSTMSDGEGAEG